MNPSSRPCWASVYGTHDILSSQYCYVLEHLHTQQSLTNHMSQWHTEGGVWGAQPPPTPTPEIPKVLQNCAKLNPIVKTVKNC